MKLLMMVMLALAMSWCWWYAAEARTGPVFDVMVVVALAGGCIMYLVA
jgi:hypothetical protein